MSSPILVLDAASPVVSVAAADGGRLLAERTTELRRSSERLLTLVEEVLDEAGVELGGLGGVAALQGPGSFTGLRIALGTVLGFHQAVGVPATALPTLPVIAAAAAEAAGGTVLAAVDAMRGDWTVQPFQIDPGHSGFPLPLAPAELRSPAALGELAPARLAGFGVGRLAETDDRDCGFELVEPPPLAAVAARIASLGTISWDPAGLTRPIYFRPPAVTVPRPPIS
ncbi:MAG: tRNA (adenosine(37)-N6)-threonylcarbamoyltransferase complex dimerization subunit type 1 TsaB [Thermoanaerobaculia bacterium]